MKKAIFFVIVMIFTLSSAMAFAGNKDLKPDAEKSAVPVKTENKLSDEEITRLTKRVEEIRDMDKSELNAKERKELRKELKEIKENVKKNNGTIVISGAALVLIIILIVLLV
jgi:peptidoglycan hydrolase CwlO-like protein